MDRRQLKRKKGKQILIQSEVCYRLNQADVIDIKKYFKKKVN